MRLTLLCLLLALPCAAFADDDAPTRQDLPYVSEDPGGAKTTCEGVLFHHGDDKGKLPGLLVVHDWKGPSKYYEGVAAQFASHGMVVLAVDCYGKGVRPKSREEAAAAAGKLRNAESADLFRARMRAGLKALLATGKVDPERIAAVGYCFGGTAVLELARDGQDVAGVISIHGGLKTAAKAEKGKLTAKVLALHGAADRAVPPAEVAAFMAEMAAAGADWQLVHYADARHAFTKPHSDRYQEAAAKRARAHALLFLDEVLGLRR